MKRNLFLRLCLILTVMLSLYSCRNEDFANQDDHPKRNNADFFKHSKKGGLNARSGIDYIDILQDYNRETNFLVTMPDQEGMPIWEKMLVLGHGEKTTLYIPLSSGETNLSSLILVNVDENNKVSVLRNFTQDYLKSFVYDTKYPSEKRKFLMDTFLQMDFLTFGQQEFTNLPTDLYEGSGEYNRLNIADVKIETAQNRGFVYNTVCTTYHYCVHGHGLGNCDYGHCTCGGFLSCFVVTSCTTSATWIDDPMGSGFPTGGGSGGGGGGTPMEHTPDPCTQAKVFYRVASGCDNGGSIDGLEDPCTRITSENKKAKTFLDKAVVAAQNTAMKTGISTSTIEKAFTFGKNPSGVYAVSAIINGPAGGGAVSMPATNPNFTTEGGVHNHDTTTYDVPSTGDIYWFSTVHNTNSHFNYYYTNGANTGAEYVYVITNPTDFTDVSTNFPLSNYGLATGGWNPSSTIGKDFESVYNYFRFNLYRSQEEAMELAQSFVIGKYNLGIGISKKDSSGNFQPIFVEEISNYVPTGNPLFPFVTIKSYQQTSTCNLK